MTALVLVDGFDKYGPAGNINIASAITGEWSGAPTGIVAPLSTYGYAANFGIGADTVTGTLPTALTRIAGSVRFKINAATAGTGLVFVRFMNAATAAFSFSFNQATGAIELRTGASTGTIVATGGAVATNTVHVLAWDVTLGATSAYAAYLDGVSLYAGTGNTGNGQTTINQVVIGSLANGNITYDDFVLMNPADAAYNSSFLTSSVVVETSFPSGDAQKQFANDGNVLWPTGLAGVYQALPSASSTSIGANSLYLLKVTPSVNCTINSVSFLPHTSSGASKFRMVVYGDTAGSPGSLLTSGTEMIGAVAGTTLTGALTTPQALTAWTPVWIGLINDTSVTTRQYDNTTNLGRRINNTYTSGAPGTGGAMTAGQPSFLFWANCTGATANFASEAGNPPQGTAASQTHSATVAQEDLYTFPALATTPSTVYGVAVKGFVAKSDSGARTVSLNMKSGASDSTGTAPNQAMSTTNQWQKTHYDTDPATGVAWTRAGLNAASSGVSVAS